MSVTSSEEFEIVSNARRQGMTIGCSCKMSDKLRFCRSPNRLRVNYDKAKGVEEFYATRGAANVGAAISAAAPFSLG